jgi:hypothetical protein
MGVQPGFADLQPKRVIDFNPIDSTVTCVDGDGKFTLMGLYVGPTGSLLARPLPMQPIDQLAEATPIRHHGVDQV